MPDEPRQAVVVTDIRMPFFSMVIFMVKWAIAAIPAFLILTVISVVSWGALNGLLLSRTSDTRTVLLSAATREAFHLTSAPALSGAPTVTIGWPHMDRARVGEVDDALMVAAQSVTGNDKSASIRELHVPLCTIPCPQHGWDHVYK